MVFVNSFILINLSKGIPYPQVVLCIGDTMTTYEAITLIMAFVALLLNALEIWLEYRDNDKE